MVEGVLQTISAGSPTQHSRKQDAVDQAGAAEFKALFELKTQQLKVPNSNFPLNSVMQITAEIVEVQRTIMQYLMSPAQKVRDEAGRER